MKVTGGLYIKDLWHACCDRHRLFIVLSEIDEVGTLSQLKSHSLVKKPFAYFVICVRFCFTCI